MFPSGGVKIDTCIHALWKLCWGSFGGGVDLAMCFFFLLQIRRLDVGLAHD